MNAIVTISSYALKDLKRVPRNILIQFDYWVEAIETEGFRYMQKLTGYNDHCLLGKRKGQRSSYLSRSWRVIYKLNYKISFVEIYVLEVNHHDY